MKKIKNLVSREARKQEFDQRIAFFRNYCFLLEYFVNGNNVVARLVVDDALCEEIIAIAFHSLCCFFTNR